jgi:hypothetical protein
VAGVLFAGLAGFPAAGFEGADFLVLRGGVALGGVKGRVWRFIKVGLKAGLAGFVATGS